MALPFSIEFIVLLGITMLGLMRERDAEVRRWLSKLVLAALGLRLVSGFVRPLSAIPLLF